MSQTWTLDREHWSRVESRREKNPSSSGRVVETGSARKREAERAALAMANSGDAMVKNARRREFGKQLEVMMADGESSLETRVCG